MNTKKHIKPQALIFVGRSGCGKGTQAELVCEYLKEIDSKRDQLYIQTGAEFREFIKGNSYTQKLSKEAYDIGGLQPEFLAASMWLNVLVKRYKGDEHLIFDGTPRKYHEAGTLDSVFKFYGFGKPYVINVNISGVESKRRLLARKRIDDTENEIKKRLEWYETDVVPAINFYRDNSNYHFLEVDGERPIEEVHEDILSRLKI